MVERTRKPNRVDRVDRRVESGTPSVVETHVSNRSYTHVVREKHWYTRVPLKSLLKLPSTSSYLKY